ncbi:MAG: TonB-dependent receptor [Gemmatimonadota bacterium]|nr:TonB-dependent receptor [Gemmatimonadota bacterium]
MSTIPVGPAAILLLGTALSAVAPALQAQEPPDTLPDPDTVPAVMDLAEIVVVGTRRGGRTAIESYSPVHVVSGATVRAQGGADLLDLLRTVVPTFNVNTQPIADGGTIVRPPNVRNLAADHTLVLVNGKRRHRGAVIAWLVPKASEGAQGPDLSTIPSIALQRVEVLRDGAAAQYGSDAIAGVMNFVLKDDRDGYQAEAGYGLTTEGDGRQSHVAVNVGLPLLDDGFLNLSAEVVEAGETVRSVQRDDAAALEAAGNAHVPNPAQIWGSPNVDGDLKTFANLGIPLGDGALLYAFGNYARKETDGGFYYRNPDNREGVYTRGAHRLVGDLTGDGSGGCPTMLDPLGDYYRNGTFLASAFNQDYPNCFVMNQFFPGGFTPRFGGHRRDYSAVAGVRGESDSGLTWDLSGSTGTNDVDFFIRNTVNAALGPANPADFEFDPGAYRQDEANLNADFSYPVTVPLLAADLNLAFGAEWRREAFQIRSGEPDSWARTFEWNGRVVDLQSQGFTAGANGFPGFSEDTEGQWARSSAAAYLETETEVREWLTVGAAARFEYYDDFGTTTNGKLSSRAELTANLALRGTLSTGFRAPTPGQANAINATSKNAGSGEERQVSIVATIAPSSPVGVALGGSSLKPERSRNASLGFVWNRAPVAATVDCFSIRVEDRLALSRDIEFNRPDLGPDRVRDDLIETLQSEGLTSARSWNYINYFNNDFTTSTRGCEVVGSYVFEVGRGVTVLDAAISRTVTTVEEFTPGGPLADEKEIRDYEFGLPRGRAIASVRHSAGALGAVFRFNYFGGWYDSEEDEDFGGQGMADLSLSYRLRSGIQVTLGADNVLDAYPELNPNRFTGLGNKYSQYAPAGFNGRFMWLRITLGGQVGDP